VFLELSNDETKVVYHIEENKLVLVKYVKSLYSKTLKKNYFRIAYR